MEAGVDDALLDESGYMVPCKVLDPTVIGVQPQRGAEESSTLIEGTSAHHCDCVDEPMYTEPDGQQVQESGLLEGEYAEVQCYMARDDLEGETVSSKAPHGHDGGHVDERGLDEFQYLVLE